MRETIVLSYVQLGIIICQEHGCLGLEESVGWTQVSARRDSLTYCNISLKWNGAIGGMLRNLNLTYKILQGGQVGCA